MFSEMWKLYLDESGDLGFDFQRKTPSAFLTIAILATSHRETVTAIRTAVKRTLRNKVNRRRKNEQELKGSNTTISVKRYFYRQLAESTFGIYAVTLNKKRVYQELRTGNGMKDRLYNYLARQVLDQIPFERATEEVELVVDKCKGKWQIAAFNEYVANNLQGRLDPRTRLHINHHNSCNNPGLSAIDLFCWGIFRRRERNDEEWFSEYRGKVLLDEQYL